MAEIMSKSNIFFNNGIIHQQNHHHHYRHRHGRVSVIPTDVSLKPLVLRSSLNSNFYGRRVVTGTSNTRKADAAGASNAQMRIGIGKAQKWWEKGLKTNMKEVKGPQDLVESLLNAGDKLVVVDFFSPGCGGCKALHPKICQLAEMNPDVQFLQVNYEEHKSMCYALNVHVLPFFRFYRGAHGRLCSFSCTNATIKKFKDALAKHSPDRCSLGPTKGLEEKELVALAANKELSFTYKPKPDQPAAVPEQEKILRTPASASQVILHPPLPLPRPLQSKALTITFENTKDKTLVTSGTGFGQFPC